MANSEIKTIKFNYIADNQYGSLHVIGDSQTIIKIYNYIISLGCLNSDSELTGPKEILQNALSHLNNS